MGYLQWCKKQWIYEFLKNHSLNVWWCQLKSNLENVKWNLRTYRATECIFRASGGSNFENFTTQHQPWWHLWGFNICISLPKKNSGYVTANKKPKQFFLKIGKISLAVLRKFDTVVVSTKSIS